MMTPSEKLDLYHTTFSDDERTIHAAILLRVFPGMVPLEAIALLLNSAMAGKSLVNIYQALLSLKKRLSN